MSQSYDLCIIGAGASGLAAANATDPSMRIVMIDKNRIPGRKILATGGGRCNLTNKACSGVHATQDFFHKLGLEIWPDSEGRYYPYSNSAADVVRVLEEGIRDRDIDRLMESEVTSVSCVQGEGFVISYKGNGSGSVRASRVILCMGGKAAPAFGTTGDGYAIARSLGHRVTRTRPILTGINCSIPDDVAGIRARGRVTLFEDGKKTASERGEIQFTADGISGICVFNLTEHIRAGDGEDLRDALERFRIEIDLAPDFTAEELDERESGFGIVTEAVSRWIPKEKLKSTILKVDGVWGWDRAQCTAGGVALEEIDERTMESKICPGLYFAGEIVDFHGPCGGFNLQHAWESGIAAGKAAGIAAGKAAGIAAGKAAATAAEETL